MPLIGLGHLGAINGDHTKPATGLAQRLNMGHVMYTSTVLPSTAKTYGTGERRWFKVALEIGTDPCMRILPAEWTNRADNFQDTTMTWPEACIVILLASFAEPGQTVAPRTAGVYVSAVRKFLQNSGVDTRFMDNSQYIRNTKAGLAQLYRIQTNRTDADRERIAITIDMIQEYYAHVGGANPTLPQLAVYTASILGFTIVARVSEYLPAEGSEHLLTTDAITFELPDGRIVAAYNAFRHETVKPKAVSILIRSKKNDKRGRGFKYHFNAAGPDATYCIAAVLWEYAIRAKPAKGQSFFYIPELQWTLKPPYFAKQLKLLGKHFGLDPARISSHSLRIGGATTLAAAGLTDGDIRNMGDWKSNTFMQYVRKNVDLFTRAQTAMSSRTAMTVRDIRNVYDTAPRVISPKPQVPRKRGRPKKNQAI